MGLGLAISKQMIELMGEMIGVESEPGRGTRFWFSLPIPDVAETNAAATNEPRERKKNDADERDQAVTSMQQAIAACVAMTALHWDLHAWQLRIKEQLKADPKKSPQSNFQFQWVLGLDDSDAALERPSIARVALAAGDP